MMIDDDTALDQSARVAAGLDHADVERISIHDDGPYHAYAQDLGFAWRWAIERDGEEVQHGTALSLQSAKMAVKHVMVFFSSHDQNTKPLNSPPT